MHNSTTGGTTNELLAVPKQLRVQEMFTEFEWRKKLLISSEVLQGRFCTCRLLLNAIKKIDAFVK